MNNVDLIVPNNHISLSSVNDINSICAPIFNSTDVDFFCHIRYYKDDSVMLLSSNGEFQRSILSDLSGNVLDYRSISSLVKTARTNGASAPYWFIEDIIPDYLFSLLVERFGIRTGIKVVEKTDDYYELYWFDSSSGKNLERFYLEHFDVLAKFIFYFREKASLLVNQYEKSKVVIPCRDHKHKKFVMDFIDKDNLEKGKFFDLYKMLDVNKYNASLGGTMTKLTKREAESFLLFGLGLSVKKTASLLGISPRTAEGYLQNIKAKAGLYSKDQLSSIYYKSLFSKIKHS